MTPLRRAAVLLGLAWAASLAAAAEGAEPAADGGERGRIEVERTAVEARFAGGEKECRERFVVASCLADAKHERRLALDGLRARQRTLDEALRRQRAADRHSALAAKAADDLRREDERAARVAASASASAAHGPGPHRLVEPGGEPVEGRKRMTFGARAPESSAERKVREERSQASFAEKQREAAAHRAQVDARAAERSKQGKTSKPLPVPGAASASSAPEG